MINREPVVATFDALLTASWCSAALATRTSWPPERRLDGTRLVRLLRGSSSGSMRSVTRRATATSRSWSITTPAGWCGPPRGGTARPSRCSSRLGRDPVRCPHARLRPCRPVDRRGGRRTHCPSAVRCADAFHIVAWAGDALELVRRQTWNTARKAGMSVHARDLKGARYAPRKNPDRLTDRQQAKLAWVAGQLPALPGLPAQGAAARGLRPQGRGRQGSAGPLAELGPPLPHPGLRRTRPADRQTPGAAIDATLETPTLQRPRGEHEHQDPAAHPHGVRLQVPGRDDRPRDAQPRRLLPTATRPPGRMTTHGTSRRALFAHHRAERRAASVRLLPD